MDRYDRSEFDNRNVIVSNRIQGFGGLESSPIVNGKIVLQQNNFGYRYRGTTRFSNRWLHDGAGNNYLYYGGRDSAYNPCYSHFYNAFYRPLYNDNQLLDEALIKVYGKLSEKVANVADILRTRLETANMVSKSLQALILSARDLRKGRVKNAMRRLNAPYRSPRSKPGDPMAVRWLEYSYGWAPLVQDVFNILDKGFGDIHLEARSQKSIFVDTSTVFVNQDDYRLTSYNAQLRKRVVVSAFAKMPNTAVAAASAWGLTNPALLAWEALPYSFVIDWFYPVGDYLNDVCNVYSNVILTDMSISTHMDYTLSCSDTRFGTFSTPSGSLVRNSVKTDAVEARYDFNRVKGIRPRPLPSFKNPFSPSTRILNQLSLLKVELSRRVS